MMHHLQHQWVHVRDLHVGTAGGHLVTDPRCGHFPANTEYQAIEAKVLSRSMMCAHLTLALTWSI